MRKVSPVGGEDMSHPLRSHGYLAGYKQKAGYTLITNPKLYLEPELLEVRRVLNPTSTRVTKNRWFQIFVYVHTDPWGRIPFCPNIFQMGWFNHQLGYLDLWKVVFFTLSTIVNRLWKLTILERPCGLFFSKHQKIAATPSLKNSLGSQTPYFWGSRSFWGSKNANLFSPQELKEVHVLLVHVKAWGRKNDDDFLSDGEVKAIKYLNVPWWKLGSKVRDQWVMSHKASQRLISGLFHPNISHLLVVEISHWS